MRKGNNTSRTLEAAPQRRCASGLTRAGLALGLIVLTSGCQRMYWYREDKTFDECRADHEDCQAELLKRTDRRYASSYKHRFIENCMQERGYELVAGKDLPLDVVREDPTVPSESPWVHAYGVAGALPPGPPSTASDGAPLESAALTRGSQRSLASPRSPPRPGWTSSRR